MHLAGLSQCCSQSVLLACRASALAAFQWVLLPAGWLGFLQLQAGPAVWWPLGWIRRWQALAVDYLERKAQTRWPPLCFRGFQLFWCQSARPGDRPWSYRPSP